MEVAVYLERQRIQQRIQARGKLIQKRMDVENTKAQARDAAASDPISLVSSDEETSCDSEATMDYPEAVAVHMPTAQPQRAVPSQEWVYNRSTSRMVPKNPPVPMTIQILWKEVQQLAFSGDLDPPSCDSRECPFCNSSANVPLMLQRRNLMERLAMLEKNVFGL